MAVVKLYPPNIAGTLPSFYASEKGTTKLVVPFSMNISVSASMISGFSLRLKTTATDIVLAELSSADYDLAKSQITFILEDAIINKLVVGNFYKVQIAYYSTTNVLGYYSTTSVIKYTNIPKISIVGMTADKVNTISSQKVIGSYSNIDTTERVYQYQFIIYEDDKEIENSGWLLHSSSSDTELASSQDEYTIKYELSNGPTYSIIYNIKTNNNLSLSSPNYGVILNEINLADPGYILDTSDLYDYVVGGIDYQNGGVIIAVKSAAEKPVTLKGTYVLTRSSSDTNYKIWDIISNVTLNIEVSKTAPYLIHDYTVVAGTGYKYGLQRYNANGIFQKKIITDIIIPYFEDLFLYDGSRQLRIRFNPKVSSFKPVTQEAKKTTLGRKYPYVLRNGIVDYKELSVSGLISYMMDNDEMFMSKEELMATTPAGFTETTDMIDENIAIERRFKLAVLDWLNDGEIKLLKSPYEGNYIVRLTNISLSPNDSTGRMIHTFTCTATEVAEYSVGALENYNLMSDTEVSTSFESIVTINLHEFLQQFRTSDGTILPEINKYDLTEGYPCRKVQIVPVVSEDEKENAALVANNKQKLAGTTFEWGEYNFTISRTGEYEIELDTAITTPLNLITISSTAQWDGKSQQGYVILTLQKDVKEDLDSITSSTLQYLCGYGATGMDVDLSDTYVGYKNEDGHLYSSNILDEFTYKTKITGITKVEYRLFPIAEFGSSSDSYLDLEARYADSTIGIDRNNFYNNRLIFKYNDKYLKRISANNYEEIPDYCTNVIINDKIYDITTATDLPQTNINSLRISSGVLVRIYGTAQTYDYGVETLTENIIQLSENELQTYIDFCAALYNFKSIESEAATEDMTLFAFVDRKFTKIDFSEKDNYSALFINDGLENLLSEVEIKKKRQTYFIAKQKLSDAIQKLSRS